LDEIGNVGAVNPLIAALKDKRAATRRSATYLLGQIGDARAGEQLLTLAPSQKIYPQSATYNTVHKTNRRAYR